MVQIISLGQLQEENKVTANKMVEQAQIQQVTTKDPKNVDQRKKLAEHSLRKREELAQMKAQKSENETNLTYNGAGAVVAIGVLGVISYYV